MNPESLRDLLLSRGARCDAAGIASNFGDAAAEYAAARERAVLCDRSAWTLIELAGRDRVRFLHNLCTNDIKKLAAGQGCEAFLTNVQGRVLAHVRVLGTEESLWLDTVPGAASAIVQHLSRYKVAEKIELTDRSAEWACLLVAGPASSQTIAAVTGGTAPALEDLAGTAVAVAGAAGRLRRNDSLALEGYELWVPIDSAVGAWQALEESGRALGLRLAGEQAYQVLRVEAGLPVYGIDMDETNFPQEIGRDRRAISFTKGCYLGQETVARIDALGHVNRHLVGLQLDAGAEPPERAAAVHAADKPVGQVTSATFSPRLERAIALAYVRRGSERPGTRVRVVGSAQTAEATVSALPFGVK